MRQVALSNRFASVVLLALLSSLPAQAQEPQDLEGGIRDLASQLAQGMAGQVKKLAVVEFPDLNGYQSTLGQFIAEELITQLSAGKTPAQFDVVERRQLARVLKEQELSDSSLFDAESIARIGKILGIEAIVTGSIADLGSDVKINARAISVESAKVFAAAAAKIPKTETVLQLMRQHAGATPASAGATSSAGIPRVTQRSDVFFQNDFLRVEVSAAALSKTKARFTLSLIFQNTSASEILLGMTQWGNCRARVIDNSGTIVPTDRNGNVLVTGLRCISSGEERAENYTRLSPGARTPVVLAFEAEEKDPFGGDVFTFSAELLKLEGDSYSHFTIGLSDIAVRN